MGYKFKKLKIEHPSKDSRKTKRLLRSAFPKDEAPAYRYFVARSKNEKIDFYAYYLDDEYVGFTYVINTDKIAYLLYFAVVPSMRGNGIGKSIVNSLKAEYEGKALVIDIEEIDEKAANNDMRIRRHHLYTELGFNDTGNVIYDYSGRYTVMTTGSSFDLDDYLSTFRLFPECLGECLVDKE